MLNEKTQSNGYAGIGANLVVADNSGNIGYQMMAPCPVRKDKTPYAGMRVLDGTTTASDWELGNNAPLS